MPPPTRCSDLHDNQLTGGIPDSWAQLAALDDAVVQPGNQGLCVDAVPDGATFELCQAQPGVKCAPPDADSSQCSSGGGGSTSSSSGSSFPVAAMAVPVAVVGAAALAAAGLLLWRRRRRVQLTASAGDVKQARGLDGQSGGTDDAVV